MKCRPILLNDEMVRAVIDGRKTQTRRLVSPQPRITPTLQADYSLITPKGGGKGANGGFPCPFGKPGDRLWLRETCRAILSTDPRDPFERYFKYLADGASKSSELTDHEAAAWQIMRNYRGRIGATVPNIHMPRAASRITLEITDTRMERLQDISEQDAIAEGFDNPAGANQGYQDRARCWLQNLWDSIYAAKHPWSGNPWVWVIEFRKVCS